MLVRLVKIGKNKR